MPGEEPKAKVFISCGQHSDEEKDTAKRIKKALICEGYDPYVAVQDQTVEGVPEAIFHQLETSEYFLFIDFKREGLVPDNPPPARVYDTLPSDLKRRGSLFSHQELAVASYLKMPIIAFHEEGVERDGIANFELVNSIPLRDRRDCVQAVADEIKRRPDWDRHWKNQLRLSTVENSFPGGPDRMIPTHFHIDVSNLHRRTTAINCQTYLEEYVKMETKEHTRPKTIELKWAGHELPGALIFPGAKYQRSFDAFRMSQAEPNWCEASSFADIGDYRWRIEGPGEFELTYVVYSYNFPPARIACKLILAKDWNGMSFKQIPRTLTKGEPD